MDEDKREVCQHYFQYSHRETVQISAAFTAEKQVDVAVSQVKKGIQQQARWRCISPQVSG